MLSSVQSRLVESRAVARGCPAMMAARSRLVEALRQSYLYPFHAVNEGIRRAVAEVAVGCRGGTLVDVGCGTRPYESLFPVERWLGFDLPESPHPLHQKRANVWFDGVALPVRDHSVQHVLC